MGARSRDDPFLLDFFVFPFLLLLHSPPFSSILLYSPPFSSNPFLFLCVSASQFGQETSSIATAPNYANECIFLPSSANSQPMLNEPPPISSFTIHLALVQDVEGVAIVPAATWWRWRRRVHSRWGKCHRLNIPNGSNGVVIKNVMTSRRCCPGWWGEGRRRGRKGAGNAFVAPY